MQNTQREESLFLSELIPSCVYVCLCAPLPHTNTDFEKHWSLVNSQCLLSTTGKGGVNHACPLGGKCSFFGSLAIEGTT